jgi:hypothetical protein
MGRISFSIFIFVRAKKKILGRGGEKPRKYFMQNLENILKII